MGRLLEMACNSTLPYSSQTVLYNSIMTYVHGSVWP